MSGPPKPADSAVFVVHIWREWSLTEPRWYGRVEHLQADRVIHFRTIEQLMTFLHQSGLTPPEQSESNYLDKLLPD